MKYFRFVDIDHPASRYPDFVVRKPGTTLVKMFFCFFALSLTGVAMALLVHDPEWLVSILLIVLGAASYYAGLQVHRNRESQRASEFQNALFASALSRGWRFCLIAAKDGTIVYANPGFQSLFQYPQEGYRLEEWLTAAKTRGEDRKALLSLIDNGGGVQIPLRMEGSSQRAMALLMSVEPIERPKGFFLLRARDNA
jgi:PAS domain-containing protein